MFGTRKIVHLSVLLAAVSLSAGCITVGDRAIRTTRTDYNIALRQTEDEQLLLNLVRLRYRDRPLFLEATALTSQFVFSPSASASIAVGTDGETDGGAGAGLSFQERPTVTYVPLQGADYVKRMLTNVPVSTLLLLDSAGWSSERVFRTCLQRMNDLDNAPRAVGPTPAEAPEFERFVRATRLMRNFELDGGIGMEFVTRHGQATPNLRISGTVRDSDSFREFASLLNLDPQRTSYAIESADAGVGDDRIRMETRSFAGILYFLSQAVEVPAKDVDAGRVTQTVDIHGDPFDWSRVFEGLMRIRSAGSRPKNAAISVRYRGHWFYIDDADTDSKSTFSLLAQLYALQSGGAQGVAPMLTLPVGG